MIQNSNNETKNFLKTKNFLVFALAFLTIIEVIFIYAFYIIRWDWGFLLLFVLGIPYLVLSAVAIYSIFKNYRCRNRLEVILLGWSIVALAAMPIAHYSYNAMLKLCPRYARFDLMDGEVLKVAYDRVEWGKVEKDQSFPINNYINLGEFNECYSLCVTKEDTLYVWPPQLADSVHSQQYPVQILPDEDDGKAAFDYATSYDRIKWKFEYDYVLDGIHTGGTQWLFIPNKDSVTVQLRSILDGRRVDDYDIKQEYRESY